MSEAHKRKKMLEHPVYGALARFYTYVHTGRPPWGGRAWASFVECGLILMGTDDKQRKQASSLPGEICLLLAGVQRGPDTRASHTDMRHVDEVSCRAIHRLPSFVVAVAARAT